MSEPHVVINGIVCTDAMAMTIRVALSCYLTDVTHNGLGDDEMGKGICEGYKQQIAKIHEIMFNGDDNE